MLIYYLALIYFFLIYLFVEHKKSPRQRGGGVMCRTSVFYSDLLSHNDF